MQIIRRPDAFTLKMDRLRRQGKRIGFVPTMGALHAGHMALVRAAKKENDVVAVSIFVNPTQFGPKEDFKRYPRPFQKDCRLLRKAGVHFLFYPTAKVMYPEGFKHSGIWQKPDPKRDLTRYLCGRHRPGHFQGVRTIVAKLFNVARPHRVYFGQKDYQQARIIAQLIEDLYFDAELRLIPTVRERDGLAISSRNAYLSKEDRKRAVALSRELFWLRRKIRAGGRDIKRLRREALRHLRKAVDRVDYLEIVDPETLKSLKRAQPRMVAAAACYVGKTRLIDNVIIINSKSN